MVIPIQSVSPFEALQNKIGDKVKINFAQGCMLDGDSNPVDSKFLYTDKDGKENGLQAEYFANKNLEGDPAKITVDKMINYSWDWHGPFDDFPQDNFSIKWTGYIKVDKTGRYTLDVSSDDGVRLYIDEKLVIDDWTDHALITNSYTTTFKQVNFIK